MSWTIERLRAAIVALAVLLLLAIVGSFFYGRWRLRHIAQDLPARLGVQIQQSTQGFVLSKTVQGRPLFTLHAARAVEFKSGGRVTLHNVEIDLYSRETGVADTIAGNDFEYDPRSQVVQSNGEAHIVLHPPPAASGHAGLGGSNGTQPVRVTTHGLTFNQKTGVATCSGEVDFSMASSGGQAMGAEYDSQQGQLLLASQVVLTTQMQGQSAVLHATRATYNRGDGQVHFWEPHYASGANNGSAEAATVLLRRNGSAQWLDAQGDVRLAAGSDMQVRAPAMQVALDERSQPQNAHLTGGVEFRGSRPQQNFSGSAQNAQVSFDSNGHAKTVVLDQGVRLNQQAGAEKKSLQRTLAADHLILHLMPAKTGNAQLESANATGNALFTSQAADAKGQPQKTTLAGQVLTAKFSGGNELQQVDGSGQTSLKMVAANGDVDSSTGDTLQVEFAPGQPEKHAGEKNTAAQSVRTAVQTGHVVLRQVQTKKNVGSQISTATAARASYVAANDTLTLTGQPSWSDVQMRMTADRMEVQRAAAKLVSTGAVQATLLPGSSASTASAGGLLDGKEPVHIIADRAVVTHDNGMATFSGRARLWQGGDTMEAPEIEVSQKARTLMAQGDSSCEQCVISNFVGEQASSAPSKAKKTTGPATFRVLSGQLVYSDAERKASFLRHVQVVSSSGALFADDAEIYLTPAGRTQKAKDISLARNFPAPSAVERIVASGNVRILQPGRSATGSHLVYTASDGHFVLTGDEKNPPQVIDLDRGTITGQVLTFASGEQAIMVSGTSGRTTTRTRVQKK